MEKVCLDKLTDVGQLIEFNMSSEAAKKLQALHICSERSDCQYWQSCINRVEDLWNRQMYAAEPASRLPS
ncbi:hypothetical protein [Pyruvatibacter sp.]|uniref:hypothetical protein n=1 Tax=Pyruvatibacter sp. TaxID=1981328 RepID=UPI00326430EF